MGHGSRGTGFSGCSTWASVAMAHRLSCLKACGLFLGQGSNLCPLHWQAILNHWTTREAPGTGHDGWEFGKLSFPFFPADGGANEQCQVHREEGSKKPEESTP